MVLDQPPVVSPETSISCHTKYFNVFRLIGESGVVVRSQIKNMGTLPVWIRTSTHLNTVRPTVIASQSCDIAKANASRRRAM